MCRLDIDEKLIESLHRYVSEDFYPHPQADGYYDWPDYMTFKLERKWWDLEGEGVSYERRPKGTRNIPGGVPHVKGDTK